jgi:hypothetical protein
VRLLCGECGDHVDASSARGLARGCQLASGLFGERRDAHVGQYLVCGAQVGAGIQAAALAAQPSAIEQVSAGELGAEPGAAEAVDRLVVQILGSLQRPRP